MDVRGCKRKETFHRHPGTKWAKRADGMRGRQGVSRASCADFDAGVVDGVDPTLKWLKCGGRLSARSRLVFRSGWPLSAQDSTLPARVAGVAGAFCIACTRQGSARARSRQAPPGGPDRPARLRQCAPRGGDVVMLLDHPSPTPPRSVGEAPRPSTSPDLSAAKYRNRRLREKASSRRFTAKKRLAGTGHRHATRRVFDPKPRKK